MNGLGPKEPQKSPVTPTPVDPVLWLGLKPPCSPLKPLPSLTMFDALEGRKLEKARSSGGELRSVESIIDMRWPREGTRGRRARRRAVCGVGEGECERSG